MFEIEICRWQHITQYNLVDIISSGDEHGQLTPIAYLKAITRYDIQMTSKVMGKDMGTAE